MFAVGAFHLPISPIVPRVMISFVAFLTIFVHLKSVMGYVPAGVWCWVMTELTFFCAVLSVAIMGNICSAILLPHHTSLADRHDVLLKYAIPIEVVIGEALLLIFKEHHFLIGMYIMIPLVVVYHALVSILFRFHASKQEVREIPMILNLISLSFLLGPIPPRPKADVKVPPLALPAAGSSSAAATAALSP